MSDIHNCDCCGYTPAESLVAVCDVLVIRALEMVGKRIVRSDRSRYNRLGNRPWHQAHTLWRPEQNMVDKALAGSWDVIPAMLQNHGGGLVTSMQVQDMVDSYVRDLLVTGTPHSLDQLRYRFETRILDAEASVAAAG